MARFSRMQVLNAIDELGLVAIFNHLDLQTAIKITEACAAGGARVVEFTNRGEFAHEVFTGLVKHFAKADPNVILGAGTIIDPATAALYIACGANFIVAPTFNPEVAKVCNRRKIAYMPGCGSASEISAAEEMGVEYVKIFPGREMGGPGFVKAVLGPTPWSRLVPTGLAVEYSQEDINAWFKAGVAAVGPGPALFPADLVAKGDFDAIRGRVAQMLEWIRQARGRG